MTELAMYIEAQNAVKEQRLAVLDPQDVMRTMEELNQLRLMSVTGRAPNMGPLTLETINKGGLKDIQLPPATLYQCHCSGCTEARQREAAASK